LPCIILLLIGFRSIYTLYVIDTPKQCTVVVKALGRQWFWQYELFEEHPLFIVDSLEEGEMYDLYNVDYKLFDAYLASVVSVGDRRNLKVDTLIGLFNNISVRFLVTGMDVLHSYAVPSLGIKIDAIPGRLNSVDLLIKRHGVYVGQCSELCGQGHGFMPIGINVDKND